ncbi:MAG: CopG family transcriptional regulator [Actinomycetota bacterium]
MPQVTLYLDSETERKLRRAAKAAGVSRSSWVMDAIRRKLGEDWPESFLSLAGAWKDFPTAEELRKGLGRDARRTKI